MHILIASPNLDRSDRLRRALSVMGAVVDSFPSLNTALTRLERKRSIYDVAIIDVDEITNEAVTWCAAMREAEFSNGIVVLTTFLDTTKTSQLLFSYADDVIRLPAAPEEVVARIYARARRNSQLQPSTYQWDVFTVDVLSLTLTFGDQRVPLSKKEFHILNVLIDMRPHIVTRDALAGRLWDVPDAVAANTIDAHIKNIRRKLAPYSSECIETIRGVGYRCHT